MGPTSRGGLVFGMRRAPHSRAFELMVYGGLVHRGRRQVHALLGGGGGVSCL